MKVEFLISSIFKFFKSRISPFLRDNSKNLAQYSLTLLFIGLGIWFITHERAELFKVKTVLVSANWKWVVAGLLVTGLYIFLQGLMYVYAFASVRIKLSIFDSIILFVKRNFISIFLPAGGISSLAFFTDTIESRGIKKSQIHFASSIYGFSGILSVVIVAIPAFIFAIFTGPVSAGEGYALVSVILLIVGLFFAYNSALKQGKVYKILVKLIPASEIFLNDLENNKIDRNKFLLTVFISVIIEFTGITHLYISMMALGFSPSIIAAVLAYIISVVFLIVSPFMRGLGAIEVSMAYVLIRFGFGNVEAIAITFLYRFFEFWAPLLSGLFAFISKLNRLLMRVLPAIFILALGLINILSVLTPAISGRIAQLREFLPLELIHASNYLVMTAGLFLIVTASFMLKGLRSAWWFAMVLSIISLIGHLTKAIDFEEATLALLVIVILFATRKEYFIKTNPKLRLIGVQTSLMFSLAIIVFGVAGFYFLDKNHFNNDFGLLQSIRYTLQNYFLVGSDELIPKDNFARDFLYSINISGFISLSFLIYTLVRSYTYREHVLPEEKILADELIFKHGTSALDFFKTYHDKTLFFSENKKAFISYRITGNFAVVLELPVAENSYEMEKCILAFDAYCYESGMNPVYYRVPESSLEIFHKLKKKDLFLGQEGVTDLNSFTLEGGSKKSMRNAINKITDRGFKTSIHQPPVLDGVLQKLQFVSNDWLAENDRSEIVFSQGMFSWEELKQQTIITVENSEEKIIAFLNIIPDFAPNEGTYDLIRKTKDAPNGVMDFILVEMFKYFKSQGIQYVNLGFAPLSGINDPHTFPERSMKFAYERIRSFSQYKGLREYKEKFEPVWHNKYLIYQHDYDLIKMPSVLSNVIKP